MELFFVIVLSIAYLSVGGMVAGILAKVTNITDWYESEVLFIVFAFILWPLTLVALIVYAFAKMGVIFASWFLNGKKK
jgi:hypothetical protein